MKTQKSLPVLMHHLISDDTSHIAVTPANFEYQCRILAENGWTGISLDQAEGFLIHGESLPPKSFLLTFDDGFLDNYVHAWPIMKKYGHKGVVFAVADRITEAGAASGTSPRPTLDDVWSGRCEKEALPPVNTLLRQDALGHTVRGDLFFSWDEARLMERSGVMAVAGHSTRHESVFAGPEYDGFLRPGDQPRTFVQSVPASYWGMPRFTRVPELANRAFIPAPELREAVTRLVPQDDAAAAAFFEDPANVRELEALVGKFEGRMGEYETPEAMSQRMLGVMRRSQEILRRELGHGIRSFCWPWGVFNEEARLAGLAAGFEVFYTTSLGVNRGGRPLAVGRFKVKNRADDWLLRRVALYSRPIIGSLYLKLRL